MYVHNRFTHALARHPASTLAAGLTTRAGNPDLALNLQQYEQYLETLRRIGLEVTVLPKDDHFPDAHYVEDNAVIYGELTFITAPGASTRRAESEFVAPYLPQENVVWMTEGSLEGGDVLFCADHRVLIGLSQRTNLTGATQLKHAIQEYDGRVKVDFVPVEGVLHLKTGMTELTPGVFLKDAAFKTDFNVDFGEVITLNADEGYSANVLPINGKVIISAGFPSTAELASRYYPAEDIYAIDMSEFEKMDGSITCLSLRYRVE